MTQHEGSTARRPALPPKLILYVLALIFLALAPFSFVAYMTTSTASNSVAAIVVAALARQIHYGNAQLSWLDREKERRVWGYADKQSIAPGDPFQLMLSTDSVDPDQQGHVEAFRVGFYGKSDRIRVWKSAPTNIQSQEMRNTSRKLLK